MNTKVCVDGWGNGWKSMDEGVLFFHAKTSENFEDKQIDMSVK